MKRFTLLKSISLLAFVIMIAINALANILPINGQSTGAVSAAYDNLFTPAGFTFSVWSIIYLSLMVFVLVQLFNSSIYRHTNNLKIVTLNKWFIINAIANSAWIFAWHYQWMWFTMLLMLIILISLIIINQTVGNLHIVIKLPFRIYLGWICVATIANVAVNLTYLGFKPEYESFLAIIMVVIAALLAAALSIKKGWFLSSAIIAWGLYGIYAKQSMVGDYPLYTITCMIAVGTILMSLAIQALASRSKMSKLHSSN